MTAPELSTAALAILIDADNANPAIVKGLLEEIAKLGRATVRRIYGDWTKPNLMPWKESLLEHSIQPIQQFAYTSGKNATDSAMIIENGSFVLEYDSAYTDVYISTGPQPAVLTPFAVLQGSISGGGPALLIAFE